MDLLFQILAILVGLVFGSFLKVIADRYNTGLSLGGRSICFSCQKTLKWYELIPILSYVFQRGRCISCKSLFSPSYALVEMLTAVLFWGSYVTLGPTIELLLVLVAFSLLVIIALYDLKHTIIPDVFVYPFIGICVLLIFISGNSFVIYGNALGALLAGPLVTLPLFLLWLMSKGTWMGFGDVKLVLGLGWLLGLMQGFSALILSFWIGAGVSLVLLILQRLVGKGGLKVFGKRLTIKSEIPFAPFLIIGFLLVYFFDITVFFGI